MKFVMERAAALRALTLAARVAPRRTTQPILGHVLVSATKAKLSFTATDMDRALTASVAGAQVGKPGTTTVSVANLLAFVRATAEGSQVEGELDRDKLVLRAGRARAALPVLPPDEFPKAWTRDGDTLDAVIDGPALATAISRVLHCVSNEETRYYLNGIYFHRRDDRLRLVATDGHRLAWAEVFPTETLPDGLPGVIVPRQAIGDLQALLGETKDQPATLEISKISIRLELEDVTFESKLIDGTFPDYDRVIPKQNDCRFGAGRVALEGAIARCAAIGGDAKTSAVKMAVEKGSVQVSRRSPDEGEVSDEIDAELQTKAAETGFNSRYMAEALAALDCPSVDVEFTPGGPIKLWNPAKPDDQLQLVMAMRV